jgi:hypothetical protein
VKSPQRELILAVDFILQKQNKIRREKIIVCNSIYGYNIIKIEW